MKKSFKLFGVISLIILAFLYTMFNLIIPVNAEDESTKIIAQVFNVLKFVLPALLVLLIIILLAIWLYHRTKAKNKSIILENKEQAEEIYKKQQEKEPEIEVITIYDSEDVPVQEIVPIENDIAEEDEQELLDVTEEELKIEEVTTKDAFDEVEELLASEDASKIAVKPNFDSGMFRHDDVYFSPIAINLEENDEDEEEEEVTEKNEIQVETEILEEDDNSVVIGKLKREVNKRHFLTKFTTLDRKQRELYSELKNEFLSYKGIRSRISYSCESFKYRGELLAKITINGKIMKLHINLNHEDFNYYKYFQIFEGDRKAYAEVPMTVKIKSERGVKNAGVLFGILMEKIFVEKSKKYIENDYSEYNGPLHFSTLAREDYKDLIMEQVGANETANYISDELANDIAERNHEIININISQYEAKSAIINTGDLEEKYKPYETVTLTSLKSRKMIDKDITHVELHAKGELTKPLDVRVQSYSLPAIKMVLVTGGNLKIRELN